MYKHVFSRVVLPPEKYIIQGIMKPERKPKEKKPLENNNLKNQGKTRRQICATCDFRDKQCGYCLIKRLGSNCPYTSGSSGYVSFKLLRIRRWNA